MSTPSTAETFAARARRRLSGAGLRGEVTDLRERVERLEQENVELRRHGMRTAEVLDIVSELLLPLSQQPDPDEVRAAIERFRTRL